MKQTYTRGVACNYPGILALFCDSPTWETVGQGVFLSNMGYVEAPFAIPRQQIAVRVFAAHMTPKVALSTQQSLAYLTVFIHHDYCDVLVGAVRLVLDMTRQIVWSGESQITSSQRTWKRRSLSLDLLLEGLYFQVLVLYQALQVSYLPSLGLKQISLC